ncbi:MAG: serpin family protein [Bacteroidota bacterium]
MTLYCNYEISTDRFIVLSFTAHAQRSIDIEGHNKLALKLLVKTHKNGKNIVLSPFNIYSNLAMIEAGAGGETEKELLQVLNSNNPPQAVALIHEGLKTLIDHKVVSIANSFWSGESAGLKQEYADRFSKEFNGELLSLSGVAEQAANQVNDWVAKKTDNKIKDIVNAGDMAGTEAALVNAILFKGSWVNPFEASKTAGDTFFTFEKKLSRAMYMHRLGPVNYYRNEWLTCYELFFHDSLSFVIATGAEESTTIDDLFGGLEYEPSAITNLVTKGETLDFYLPKFKFNNKTNLIPTLEKIGLTQLFTASADLSKMFEGPGLRVNKIIHSAAIELNEQGVEAAAATASGFARSMPADSKT